MTKKYTKTETINIIADILLFAKNNHFGDADSDVYYIQTGLESASYISACFLSTYLECGVESNHFIDYLESPKLQTREEWIKIVSDEIDDGEVWGSPC